MKKILTAFILSLVVLSRAPFVHAQEACSTITQGNYAQCCDPQVSEENAAANNQKCSEYEATQQGASTTARTGTIPVADDPACIPLTSTNIYSCCSSSNPKSTSLQNACVEYYANNKGQVGSTPTVNPVSTSTTTTIANTNSTASITNTQASACSAIKFKTLLDILIWAKCMINVIVIPGIFTLAFVVFLWGVFKFIRSTDPKEKDSGKQFIYMGLIGLFVMVSVWGIIKIAATTFGFDTVVPVLQTDYLTTSNASK